MAEKKMKKAKNSDEAWNIQETYSGQPHGWLQWKGTNVCMDFYCKCGYHSHIDDDFTYNIRCPACKTVYHCNRHIEMIELEEEPDCVVEGEGDDLNEALESNAK
jgi:hypothetical protein